MNKENVIVLDVTGCKNLDDLHRKIKWAFDFPDYYGENWSAFDDLIGEIGDNTVIEIKGISSLSKEFDWHIKTMLEILEENKEEIKKIKERYPHFDCQLDYRVVD